MQRVNRKLWSRKTSFNFQHAYSIFAEPNTRNAKPSMTFAPVFGNHHFDKTAKFTNLTLVRSMICCRNKNIKPWIDSNRKISLCCSVRCERAGTTLKLEGSKFRSGMAVLEFTAFLLLYLFISFVRKWVRKWFSIKVCFCEFVTVCARSCLNFLRISNVLLTIHCIEFY